MRAAPVRRRQQSRHGIFVTLSEEHELLMKLANRCVTCDISNRRALLDQLHTDLCAHQRAEEDALYSVLLQSEASDLAEKGIEQHDHIESCVARAREGDPRSREWVAAVSEVRNLLERNICFEEMELFQAAADAIDSDTERSIVQRFLEERRKSAN